MFLIHVKSGKNKGRLKNRLNLEKLNDLQQLLRALELSLMIALRHLCCATFDIAMRCVILL